MDACDCVLGRLASQITKVLRGKNKVDYTPYIDCGDNIVVINASKIKLTSNKSKNKVYYRHTGYPGGIKKNTAANILTGDYSYRVLHHAVKGMLPKESPLARRQMKNLYIYPYSQHNHIAQKPTLISL